MYTPTYLCILIILLSQGPARVESLPLSQTALDKMRSIVKWLDTISDATVFDYIQRVNRGAGLNLFEGDIKDYTPNNPQTRTAITNHQQLWNSRVVPYVIDSTYDSAARKEVMAAMEEFRTKTCIKFVPRTTQADYVVFKQTNGCYSNIGRNGGAQEISLTNGCLKKGTAIHEMMHALGFWHEQSRPDRESWVHIINSNIQDGKGYNFEKLTTSEADTLGESYDYGSVMHYSKYAFSKNGNPTIMPTRRTDAPLGQRSGMSEKDVHKIRKLYRCDSPAATTPAPEVTTKMTTTKKPAVTTVAATKPTNPPVTAQPSQTHAPVSTHAPTSNTPSHAPTSNTPSHTTSSNTAPHAQTPNNKRTVQTTTERVTMTAATTTPQAPPLSMLHVGWSLWSEWSTCDLSCSRFRIRMCLNSESVYCPGKSEDVEPCPPPCKHATFLGCWAASSANLSIPSVEGSSPELSENYTIRPASVNLCQIHTALHGYNTFALLDNGQCLTSMTAFQDFRQQGPATGCGKKGSKDAMSVYTFETDIDGQWSPWTGWSHCTRSCGMGRQYRYRRCDNPPPVGQGAPCPGHDREAVICNVGQCIVPIKCGNRYHMGNPGTSGLIWVRDYENFMECEYEITSGQFSSTISLYIQEINIENSKGCIYDSLMIFDGMDSRSPLVGAFCGNSQPRSFESTTNKVFIKFQSDETNKGGGYTIFYSINSASTKACVKPPPTAHAAVFIEGNMVGNRAWYACNPGFRMVGKSPITCLDQPGFALWNDHFPRCVLSKKRSVGHGARYDCTFEDSWCGFQNDIDGDFKWNIKQSDVITDKANQNSSIYDADNSINPSSGNVLFAESSVLQAPGDSARVKSRVFEAAPYPYCLEFTFNLDGLDMTYLEVRLMTLSSHTMNETGEAYAGRGQRLLSEPQSESVVWQVSGDQTEGWSRAHITLQGSTNFQVVFEAVLGSEIGSSVAIDNVSVTYGGCPTSGQ